MSRPSFGAFPQTGSVRFRVCAPAAGELRLILHTGAARGEHKMYRDSGGLFDLTIAGAAAGDRYSYSIDGSDPRPDPASRFQPDGVHGPSEVIDPAAYTWHDHDWHACSSSELIVYELHVGTFSPPGTFEGARAQLASVADLGVTAIELMPVADFAGSRNWGYDGVCLFAPSHSYGRPGDLRALVDHAHRLGLSVLLDVVYNHLGPEGAYLTAFMPEYFSRRHENPWGHAINLDGPGAEIVRAFILDSATHWMREYHLDGLRLDATHTLIDDGESARGHFVRELASTVRREAGRPVFVHAEDYRNLAEVVLDDDNAWGLDGVWADDFHHLVRRLLAGDTYSYYADYAGTTTELETTIRQGWLYTGQMSRHVGAPRGTDPSRVPMKRFVVCVQNHDQIGNRAMGDRLDGPIDPAAWRAASALLLMVPMTPLLFMGQEWAASTPFRYFTDLEPDLGTKVTEGRRREFKDFPAFSAPEARERIPDPQAPETFESSKLRWDERDCEPHRSVLALYRALIALRRQYPVLAASDQHQGCASAPDADSIVVRRQDRNAVFWIVVRLRGAGDVGLAARDTDPGPARRRVLLTTEDAGFATDPQPPVCDAERATVRFARPGAVIVMARRN